MGILIYEKCIIYKSIIILAFKLDKNKIKQKFHIIYGI